MYVNGCGVFFSFSLFFFKNWAIKSCPIICLLSFRKEIPFTDYRVATRFQWQCPQNSVYSILFNVWHKVKHCNLFFARFKSIEFCFFHFPGRIFNDPKKENHHLYRCQRQYNRRRIEKNDWRYAREWPIDLFDEGVKITSCDFICRHTESTSIRSASVQQK